MSTVDEPTAGAHLRIARPVTDLARSSAMYRRGLKLELLGSFSGHAGFDGVMLGAAGAPYHFELTFCRHHPVKPSPTEEDLIVLYVADRRRWEQACADLRGAGFTEVESFNPYWGERGRTFVDPDGYRFVLENAAWRSASPT